MELKFKTLKEQYVKMLADKILVSLEDLSDNEKILIEESYNLWQEKLEDIKILEDENRRISIELGNLKDYVSDLHHDRGMDYEEDYEGED